GKHERQTAEFGELTYHFSDSLSLAGGVRHYDVANSLEQLLSGWYISLNPFVSGLPPTSQTLVSSSAKGFVYKGNLSYKLTPDQLLYAQYVEGFRPGFGTTPPPVASCGVPPPNEFQVQPDSIKSYELGAKTGWLERR